MNERSFFLTLSQLRDGLASDDQRARFDTRFLAARKTPLILYGFSYFLGWLGIDRFILGHWQLGLIKLLVCFALPFFGTLMAGHTYDDGWGALTVFYFLSWIDLFFIGGATRKWNHAHAMAIAEQVS